MHRSNQPSRRSSQYPSRRTFAVCLMPENLLRIHVGNLSFAHPMLFGFTTHIAPSRAENAVSPIKSPIRPISLHSKSLPRKSLAPRPSSIAMDKAAPIDDRITHLKTFFHTISHSRGASPDGNGNINGNGGPLREISSQVSNLDVD